MLSDAAIQITILIFIAAHTGALIWHFSRLNTTLTFLKDDITELRDNLAGYVSSSNLSEKLKRIWDAIDALRSENKELKEKISFRSRRES